MPDRDSLTERESATIDRAISVGVASVLKLAAAVGHADAIERALAQLESYGRDPVRSAVFVRVTEGDIDALECALRSALAQHSNHPGAGSRARR